MNTLLEEKIQILNTRVDNTFKGSDFEAILNHARKAGEALCEAILIKKFGNQGEDIINGMLKRDLSRTRSTNPQN